MDGLCPQHGIPPEHVEEKNYFFRLSAYQERLLRLYDERPDFVLPCFRYNEARSFIEHGLDDISVSRASQRWGVPVPWDPEQIVYVWVDALINYWSALAFARPGEDLRPRFWPEVRHLLAKDILKFHCVIWPALLLAAGLDVPKQLFVHGYLLLDERKMSKSIGQRHRPARPDRRLRCRPVALLPLPRGHVRAGREHLDRRPARALRARARQRPGQPPLPDDGDDRALPAEAALRPADGVGRSWRPSSTGSASELAARLDELRPHRSARADLGARAALNRHVEQTAPWELAKDDGRAETLDRVLYELADGLRAVAVALSAYVPDTAERILSALGQPADLAWEGVAAGRRRRGRGDRARRAALPAGGRAHGGCVTPPASREARGR